MTAQVENKLTYQGKNGVVNKIRIGRAVLFDPCDYGFIPDGKRDTSMMNGYFCEYKIENNCLLLDKLCIYDKRRQYPLINGLAPEYVKPYEITHEVPYGEVIYSNLNLLCENVSTRIDAKNDDEWLEFVVENGKVTDIIDNSDMYKEIIRYCKERMTPEEFEIRGKFNYSSSHFKTFKRDVDMLPYSFILKYKCLRETIGMLDGYNSEEYVAAFYELTKRNSKFDFEKDEIITIDDDRFNIFDFKGEIEITRNREMVTERHFLRKDRYFLYTNISHRYLNIYDPKKCVKIDRYELSDVELDVFKNRYSFITIIEEYKEGEKVSRS